MKRVSDACLLQESSKGGQLVSAVPSMARRVSPVWSPARPQLLAGSFIIMTRFPVEV